MSGLRLRHVALVNPPVSEWDAIPDEELLTFVPLEAVWPDRPDFTRLRTKAEVSTGYTRFKEGDVIVPKITPTFEADRSLVVAGLPTHIGAGTTELHVIRPSRLIDAGYVNYLVSTRTFLHGGEAEMIGVAGQKRVPDAWLRDCPVPITSIVQQRAIADFLDRETARIDALITAKRRMIEALEARFESLRTRLISEGLSSSPSKETGHLFFPSIPATWELRSLSAVVEPNRPIVYGIVQPGPDIADGVLYVKTGDLPDLDIGRMSRTSAEIASAYRRAALRDGDIVVAMRASIGTCARVPTWLDGGNLTQGTARVAPAHGIDVPWLLHAMQSQPMSEQMLFRAVGTTYLTLNIADLRKVALPVPPLPTQKKIAAALDESQDRMVGTSAALKRQIELLVEHRQALITAAVTGELAIPGVAA